MTRQVNKCCHHEDCVEHKKKKKEKTHTDDDDDDDDDDDPYDRFLRCTPDSTCMTLEDDETVNAQNAQNAPVNAHNAKIARAYARPLGP
mmetsp:Transcript_14621/g.38783  ORF Transcript_14621/g.38783 Transcript_14621/m.38783 type:complete len:89 (-) Transcript_14621:9-275(-)